MLRAADAGHDHVQVVQLAGIDPRQRTGEEIRLLLVVAFQHHPIARRDQRLQRGDQAFARQHRAVSQAAHALEAPLLFLARRDHCGGGEIGVVMSAPGFTLS